MNRMHAHLALVVVMSTAILAACSRNGGVDRQALLDANQSAEPAPETFKVRFETSKGAFVIEAHHAWAPLGVDRFYYLVRRGFYDGNRFFRVVPNFMVQFGINGDPQISAAWRNRVMPDDTSAHQSNLRGRVSFGTRGPHTRTSQLFINFRNNTTLDRNYQPIAEVVEGMSVVDNIYSGYGEGPPSGRGPNQERIMTEGNKYLATEFPALDSIVTARIVK